MSHPIPAKLNLLLLFAASGANLLLLYTASHAPWWAALPAALLFGFSNNTLFSLLHESVHGVLLPGADANRAAGRFAALWFPTGWAVQQAFHLNHHRHNRSESEQFDTLHPHDVRWLKYAQWYAIFSGLYWLVSVVGVVLYAATPRALRQGLLRLFGRRGRTQTGAGNYIGVLDSLPAAARWEVAAAVLWQLLLFWLLELSLPGWLACYAVFGFYWSSLQYTDHAFSPLDRKLGAWNLQVPSWLRRVFLNYPLHLAHHQHPELPWPYLPRYANRGPRFVTVWRACWRGPKAVADWPQFPQERLH